MLEERMSHCWITLRKVRDARYSRRARGQAASALLFDAREQRNRFADYMSVWQSPPLRVRE